MTSISILDQSPIDHTEAVSDGIKRTVELAQLAENLNYTRYFVAEHHNIQEVVGTSPEILVTHLLNQTSRINIGSGGVMLQHYSPFKVIEQFHFMSQIAPGRVDLGIGKAPGGFPLATQALQEDIKSSPTSFNDKFHLLNQFNNGNFPKENPYSNLKTTIRNKEVEKPHVFLLGGSERSARFAAEEKVAFIYAYFLNSDNELLQKAIRTYKAFYPEGRIIVALAAVVSNSEAEYALIEEGRTNYVLHFDDGQKLTVSSEHQIDDFKKQSSRTFEIEAQQIEVFNGTAESIKQQIHELNIDDEVDEFMFHMPVQNHSLRLKTVEQLARVYKKSTLKAGVK